MKKSHKIFMSIAVAFVIIACDSNSSERDADATLVRQNTIEKPISIDTVGKVTSCYQAIINKDTITLNLAISENLVDGHLHYNFFEKDENIGKINGKLLGDTLVANYTFQAEGVESEREVVFLTKNNIVYEGFGDLIEKDGKTIFKDKSKLKFSKTFALKNVICN